MNVYLGLEGLGEMQSDGNGCKVSLGDNANVLKLMVVVFANCLALFPSSG